MAKGVVVFEVVIAAVITELHKLGGFLEKINLFLTILEAGNPS